MRQQFFHAFRRAAFLTLILLFGNSVPAQNAFDQNCRLQKWYSESGEIVDAIKQRFNNEAAPINRLNVFLRMQNDYLNCLTRASADYAAAHNESVVRPSETAAQFYERTEKAKLDSFFAALDLSVDKAEDNIVAAQTAFLLDKKDFAAKFAAAAVALDDNNAEAHFALGKIKQDLASVERAVKFAPALAPAYLLKAELIIRNAAALKGDEQRAQYKTALEAVEKSLALSTPVNAQDWRDEASGLREFLKVDAATLQTAKSAAPAINAKAAVIQLKIYSKPAPGYTETARRNDVSGTVRLLVVFGADATIKSVLPLTYLGGGLTQQALKAAKRIGFEPETRDGVTVSTVKTVEYAFRIY